MTPSPGRLALLSAMLPLASACAGSHAVSRPAPAAEAPARQPVPAPAAASATRPPAPAAEVGSVSPRAQRLFEEAVTALEEQKKLKVPIDWEALERKWRLAAEAQDVPEAWFNLGVTLERQGRTAEARQAYQRALGLRPGFAEPAVNLAVLEEPGRDPRAAAREYAELVRRHPDDGPARVRLASLYRAAGQLDEAWRLSREALARDPKAIGAYKVMTRVALDRGNADLAELLALRAQKLDEADPEVIFFLGEGLARRGDDAGAAVQFRRALSLRPGFLPARYALLRQALVAQAWESAAAEARSILQVEPGDAQVHLALGVALRYLGKADEAAAAYDRAESIAGAKLPEVHLNRGLLLMKLRNRCEPAIAEFRRYQARVGPAAAASSPAPALQRECEQMAAQNRAAEEAARQMQRDAEEAARKAQGGTPAPPR